MQSNIKIDISFKCIIGLLEFERLEKQKIRLVIDAQANEFLDYAKVAKKAKKYIKKKEFKKVEKALKSLAKILKKHFKQIKQIHIELYKTQIIKDACVGAYYDKKY